MKPLIEVNREHSIEVDREHSIKVYFSFLVYVVFLYCTRYSYHALCTGYGSMTLVRPRRKPSICITIAIATHGKRLSK